ncbi:hypothetical protein ABT248_32440 [Streptomyces sp. NPDC000971]|uniref:hypothetical protein n=1 Tax=Streptomyces sp. NPDC000971 TaxID=3156647 RepID=UPI0033176CC8
MHRPHHPERRPSAFSSAAQAAEDDFENAVFTVADPPVVTNPADAVDLSFDELRLCGAEPLRLVVLLNWRFRAKDGLPCAPEDIWASLTERGILDVDGESPLLLDDVTRALAFLERNGALGGEL